MNLWKTMNTRWPREELSSWPSLKKTAYILMPMLIYFAVHDMAEILLWSLLEVFMSRSSKTTVQYLNDNAYTINGLINGLTILIGVAVIWKATGGEIQAERNQKDDSTASKKRINYMIVGSLAFTSAIGINMLLYLSGILWYSSTYQMVSELQYGVDFVIGLILYGIVSPFAEEAVFRGLIFNRMKRCFKGWIALIVSALLFGCYHGNLVQAVYGTLLGLLIAYTYEKYQSFAAPVLFHAVANISIYAMNYHKSFYIGRHMMAVLGGVMFLTTIGILIYMIKSDKNKEKTK